MCGLDCLEEKGGVDSEVRGRCERSLLMKESLPSLLPPSLSLFPPLFTPKPFAREEMAPAPPPSSSFRRARAALSPAPSTTRIRRTSVTTVARQHDGGGLGSTTAATLAASLASLLGSWDPCSPPASLFASPGTRGVCEQRTQTQQQKQQQQRQEEEAPPLAVPPRAETTTTPTPEQRAAAKELIRDILASDNRAHTQELVDAAMGVE